jgi:hypothetical protein
MFTSRHSAPSAIPADTKQRGERLPPLKNLLCYEPPKNPLLYLDSQGAAEAQNVWMLLITGQQL